MTGDDPHVTRRPHFPSFSPALDSIDLKRRTSGEKKNVSLGRRLSCSFFSLFVFNPRWLLAFASSPRHDRRIRPTNKENKFFLRNRSRRDVRRVSYQPPSTSVGNSQSTADALRILFLFFSVFFGCSSEEHLASDSIRRLTVGFLLGDSGQKHNVPSWMV